MTGGRRGASARFSSRTSVAMLLLVRVRPAGLGMISKRSAGFRDPAVRIPAGRSGMRRLPLGLCFLLTISTTSVALADEAKRPLRFEEMVKLGRLGGFAVSPDGSRVAYAMGTPDVDANDTPSQIWSVSTSGGGVASVRLTDGKNDTSPAFSPDGKRLAFLSDRENG